MTWKNWAGNVTASPSRVCVANCESDLLDVVNDTKDSGQTIRAVGTGHSFSAICATNDILVSLEDREACSVSNDNVATVWAGSKIGTVASALWEHGCSFENQSDIDVQSIAGALGTGTHGTGTAFGSFSARTKSLRLITADGDIHEIADETKPDLLRAAALSVGMLGLISEASVRVSPSYHLREQTQIVEVDECFDAFTGLSEAHRNIEFYWLPGFDKCITKTLDIMGADDTIPDDDTELPPPGTIERYLRPTRANKAYLVYRNIRTVPFLEMEYSVPIEVGMACVTEIRQLMRTTFPEKTWVVEYRTQARDNLLLSPAFGRPVAAISVHDQPGAHRSDEYFRACEDIFIAYDGRPHWGKLCFLSPSQHTDRFPEFALFARIRQHLDPQEMFLNDFLRPLFS